MPTVRVGGLDVLCHGLASQSFTDFELIISDGLYDYRKDIVEEESRNYSFPIKHIEPSNNPFPINAFCKYANAGLIQADCEFVLFLTDYTWLPPTCLSEHINTHSSFDNDGVVMSPHRYVQLPTLMRPIQYRVNDDNYSFDGIDTYINDIKSNLLTDLMWSIFKEFDGIDQLNADLAFGHDTKINMPHGPINHLLFYGKNESVKLEHILSVNGWDEDLDGSHGYQDSDLADRLFTQRQLTFFNVPHNVAHIVNPRSIFPHCKRLRPIESNNSIWESKRAQNYINPINSYSINEMRSK
jgi:hypothetical protein